jgi:hypothetical protein
MQRFFDILQWTVVAAILVVLITHMQQAAVGITSFGNFWTKETGILASGGSYTGA